MVSIYNTPVCTCMHCYRYHFKIYQSVFKGSDFVDWLMRHELAESREDAVHYYWRAI